MLLILHSKLLGKTKCYVLCRWIYCSAIQYRNITNNGLGNIVLNQHFSCTEFTQCILQQRYYMAFVCTRYCDLATSYPATDEKC